MNHSTSTQNDLFLLDEETVGRKLLNITQSEKEALLESQKLLNQKLESNGLNFEGKSYPVSIRPMVLSASTVKRLKDIGERFSDIFDKFARAWIDNKVIREYFPMYRHSEHFLFNLPNHTPLVRIFRLDGLFDENGTYQVIETNTDCPGGVIQNGLAGAIWSSIANPLLNGVKARADFQPFVKDNDLFLKQLVETHQERTGMSPNRAAIVTYKGRFKNEVSWMAEGLNRLGIATEIIDAALLKRRNNRLITPDGQVIDLAYNKLDLRDLIDEPEVEEYLTAASNGEVTFINPLICQWPLADKAIMAVLSDSKMLSFLSEDDRMFCLKHIPWTRVVNVGQTTSPKGDSIELIDWAMTHREQLVLKPSNATRGEGLLIGCFTDAITWHQELQNALNCDETWIVQQYIRGHLISAVHPDSGISDSMWSGVDTYVYGGKFAGFQARASFDPVMNVGRRGIILPIVLVEENQ